MEVDSDEEIGKRTTKKDEFEDDDFEEDSVVWERNVVVCNSSSNTEMYCVSYPSSKRDAWDPIKFPIARFKKNVRLLEMRFIPDTKAGSYNKRKAESFSEEGSSSSPQKNSGISGDLNSLRKNDEIYEGRAFINDHPIINTIGFMKNDQFYIHPIIGNFGMHRSISILNNSKKKGGGNQGENEDEGMSTENEEEEAANTSTGNVRVKFSRPETERQKKRREASALHREKVIASDVWIPMKVHLEDDQKAVNKFQQISRTGVKSETENGKVDHDEKCLEVRDLVNRAIICSIKEELVIESGKEHMLSKQRIDELGVDLQIRAHMVKAHVIRTNEMIELIGKSKMSKEQVIHNLQKCARLVNGVWVLQSDFLFNNLPPAHSNVAGRTDVYRSELWRNARDLALCLIDGGHRVTRLTLMTCFKLSDKDAEEVLSTFGVKDEKERRWKLRIEKDETFLDDPSVQSVIISEKQRWVETFEELQKLLSPSKPKK